MAAMEEGKIDFVVKIKGEQGKNKTSVRQKIACVSDYSKNCLKQYVIAFCVTFFFLENAKIWVGRTMLINREKKGDGQFSVKTIFP